MGLFDIAEEQRNVHSIIKVSVASGIDIADRMLFFYYNTYLKNKEKLLRICTERE